MKLGVTIPNIELGNDLASITAFVQAAEDLGYDYLMLYDHVIGADLSIRPDWKPFMGNPPIYTLDDAFHEPLVLYGFIAAVTKTIELATGVIISPQRQTVLLAKQAAELDILSEGRLRLGLGIGWNDVEYQALGMNFNDRGKRSAEQIEVMRALWTNRCISFEGKWHTLKGVGINPLPIQKPIPVWLGGAADSVLKRIAKLADGWYAPSYLDETQLKAHIERLHSFAEEEGRSVGSVGIEGIIRMWGRSPEQCAESLDMWERLGATHVTFNTESDSYKDRLPGAQMETLSGRSDFKNMDDRIEALRLFKDAVNSRV
jgi:probable F420-dependent oxidoreductase